MSKPYPTPLWLVEVVGFLTSGVAGTFVGALADAGGRRRWCLAYFGPPGGRDVSAEKHRAFLCSNCQMHLEVWGNFVKAPYHFKAGL